MKRPHPSQWVFVIPIVVMLGGLGVALSMRDTHRDARPIG